MDGAPALPEGTATTELLLFRARGITFGVALDQVDEIAEVEEFVKIASPAFAPLRGALLCHDRPVPMVDVARRLGIAAGSRYMVPVLLVTRVAEHTVGFLVDDPEDVVAVGPGSFRALPEIVERSRSQRALYAIALHGDRIVELIDLPLLLDESEAALACREAERAFQDER